ncbi:WD40-repeat-containing domain protein [Irpex lacteus]|nr:WD40-repeat-containing domain protein [Irpex lacteus]
MDPGPNAAPIWQAPSYDVTRKPDLKHVDHSVGRTGDGNNFSRSARWCPDGSVALAQCENATLQYLDIPSSMLSDVTTSFEPPPPFSQPSPILDFTWYPFASVANPASFCFLASVRECPVKLLDAATGRLRASYKIVDHRERHVAPYCMAFNGTATKIYCGFEDAIEVFDTQYPGEGTRWHTTPSKKSRDGLKGIISALAFSSDTSSGVFAAGSLSPSSPASSNLAIFTETTGEVPVMFVGNESGGTGLGVPSSVSQVMFNPARPYLLYASFRRHDYIYTWDLRGDVSSPIQRFQRAARDDLLKRKEVVETNQRLRFDVDIGGNWLSVGNQYGEIYFFDLNATAEADRVSADGSQTPCYDPTLVYDAHDDAVGSVAFHPFKPLLLSVSGSRHFDEAPNRDQVDAHSESSNDSNVSSEEDESVEEPQRTTFIKRSRMKPAPLVRDASAKLWSFGHSTP